MSTVESVVRGSVMASVIALGLSVAGSAAARDDVDPNECVPEPGNVSAVVCTVGGGSSPSTFLGAFASDNNGKGGWVEYYADDDGEWWVEHHADGGTSVGWDAGDFGGASYVTGPNLSFGSKEGAYANKKKPALKGKVTKGPKLSYASAKAAASKKTATVSEIRTSATATLTPNASSTPVELSLSGSGQCKASIIVQRGGQFVSSTGIVPMTFPSKRTVALPAAAGDYTVSLQGRDGCLGQTQTASIKVTTARPRINLGGLLSKR